MNYMHLYPSPLGEITLESDGENLVGLWFGRAAEEKTFSEDNLPVFEQADRWLNIYFSGKEPDFTPPLHVSGSDFQKGVWQILLTIPYGRTRTYGDIAAQIASERGISRMSAQAVGGAVGRNPVSIIIPCHRVVGSDGSLTGYGGGIWRKEKLLELEAVNP